MARRHRDGRRSRGQRPLRRVRSMNDRHPYKMLTMRRRLFTLASALSLLLCVATGLVVEGHGFEGSVGRDIALYVGAQEGLVCTVIRGDGVGALEPNWLYFPTAPPFQREVEFAGFVFQRT